MIEKIACSAIWYKELEPKTENPHLLPKNIKEGIVIYGLRHAHCIAILGTLTGLRSVENGDSSVGEYKQGFLTTKNRFVDREEAWIIACDAKQIKDSEIISKNLLELKTKKLTKLYSEDLY